MNLNVEETISRFITTIYSTARKYNKKEPSIGQKDVKSVIIVPEGTLEAKIFTLLADHLNGENTSTILKPKKGTGLGYLDHLSTHLEPPSEVITIVLDRDCLSEEKLLEDADRRLAFHGFTRTDQVCPHCYEYTGINGGRPYTVHLLVNGCDEIETEQHTIEDHLLRAGGIQCEENCTSKQTWHRVPREDQERIIEQLANGGTGLLRNNFPQHYATIEKIKTLI